MIDVYSVMCYGMPIRERKCYGVPYDGRTNFNDRELSCNYPCDDEKIRLICKNRVNITLEGEVHSCEWLINKCSW